MGAGKTVKNLSFMITTNERPEGSDDDHDRNIVIIL
jgi:hypothetical protein